MEELAPVPINSSAGCRRRGRSSTAERSVVARELSVRFRPITPAASGHSKEVRQVFQPEKWKFESTRGRQRVGSSTWGAAASHAEGWEFESPPIHHWGCRLRAGSPALNEGTPVRVRPALPNTLNTRKDPSTRAVIQRKDASLQREDPGSSPGGPTNICVELREHRGLISREVRTLGHATTSIRNLNKGGQTWN